MPLNHELTTQGARLMEASSTAPDYRLYMLQGSPVAKPGLLRVRKGEGSAIEVEVWAMPADSFGRFVAAVPSPLSIGNVQLRDGRSVKGFLVEATAIVGSQDISRFGGWRAYMAQRTAAAE